MATPPEVTIEDVTRTKISDEPGLDECQVTFTVDKDIKVWESRADGSAHGEGLLVGGNKDTLFGFSTQESTVETGSEGFGEGEFFEEIPADTEITYLIEDEELTKGDKVYTINIYVKDLDGTWNDD